MKLINQQVWRGVDLTPIRRNLYGIEIEVENYLGQSPMSKEMKKNWTVTDDPSLRQGLEFVSKPISQITAGFALDDAQDYINQCKLTANSRCGVHVHVNMLNVTWGQMWSFIALYTLMEPEIFARFAPGRDENHFCVPVFWNTQMVTDMGRDIGILRQFTVGDIDYKQPTPMKTRRGGGPLFHNPDEMALPLHGSPPRSKWFPVRSHLNSIGKGKYGALTTYRLPDLGTVELRLLPGTTNMEDIKTWLAFVARLKYQSMKYNDPLELQAVYETDGPDALWKRLRAGPRPIIKSEDKDDAEESAYKLIGIEIVDKSDYEWKL